MRKSEELLTRAQRAARVGIWDWNVVTGEANWTEESWRLFGHPPFSRPVTHELWLESVHPDDREQMVAKVQEALRERKIRRRVPGAARRRDRPVGRVQG